MCFLHREVATLTGRKSVRRGLFGKMILMVEVKIERFARPTPPMPLPGGGYQPIDNSKPKHTMLQWRDATVNDFLRFE